MNCAFLMSSCDSYSDTWDPFFQLLAKYWPTIPFPVYLNTETKQYHPSKPLPFEVITCNTVKNTTWSDRMHRVLESIPEEYVFHVLDDFFIKSPVPEDLIFKLLEILDEDPALASFQLITARIGQVGRSYWHLTDEDIFFVDTGASVPLSLAVVDPVNWKTSFNPTLWRKSVFMKWLRKHESIWNFEQYGSQRARIWKYPEKVYYVVAPMIYDYLLANNTAAIALGKWQDEDAIRQFFADEGIHIDYASRGWIKYERNPNESKSTRLQHMLSYFKKYTIPQLIQRCFYRVLSFF